jgi:SAM-dependent methyltransferase
MQMRAQTEKGQSQVEPVGGTPLLDTVEAIDWNAVLRAYGETRRQAQRNDGVAYWNKRAPSFADHAGKTHYPEAFLRILQPAPAWSVLDMGCGAGTLALPLAGRVARITAVDQSEKMLELLGAEVARRGIRNIAAIRARWEDDWDAAGIGQHDVAVASRSLITDDARAAIAKLVRAARRRVAISTVVGDGPHDRRLCEAVGRPLGRRADYVCLYHLLHQMGIHAEVSFIREERQPAFASVSELIESRRWMFPEITPDEERRLSGFVAAHLSETAGGWTLDYPHVCNWAVFHWDKSG